MKVSVWYVALGMRGRREIEDVPIECETTDCARTADARLDGRIVIS